MHQSIIAVSSLYGEYLVLYVFLPNGIFLPCEMTVISIINAVCTVCHTCSKSMGQPGKVANPARGQLNREK